MTSDKASRDECRITFVFLMTTRVATQLHPVTVSRFPELISENKAPHSRKFINSEVCGADLFESDLPQNVPTADILRSRSGASVTSTEVGRIQADGARHPSLGNHGKHRCGKLPGATSSATCTDHPCRTCAAELSRPGWGFWMKFRVAIVPYPQACAPLRPGL
jgi:hypothetical protein